MLLRERGAATAWQRWRDWRRGRPFWGGLLTLVAGAEICYLPLAPLKVMIHEGVAGIPSILMGLCLIVMGLAMWFSPQSRVLAGVGAVLVALAALVLSNLGGFLLGTLLAIAGGSLGFAWRPVALPPPQADPVADTEAAGDGADEADGAGSADGVHSAHGADKKSGTADRNAAAAA